MKLTAPITNRSMQIRTAIFAIVLTLAVMLAAMLLPPTSSAQTTGSYPVVDTGQSTCYDDSGLSATCPAEGGAFYGQDAQFTGDAPSYTSNGDPSTGSGQAGSGQAGSVTDNVTGLIWQQSPDTDGDGDIDAADKMSYANAVTYCENLTYAGVDDWTLPTIKQLYSLIDFSGVDPSGYEGADTSGLIPFIDTDYFDFAYGDTDANERIIDSQYASSTLYVSDAGEDLLFGVNFADGRIKGYGLSHFGRDKTFLVACVHADDSYGVNDFVANPSTSSGQAGAITDNATGLMWAQDDSGSDAPDGLNWEEALAYVEAQNDANYLGHSDWRLPNIKELQSIVDYSRSPDTTNSAAIDPLFNATAITNEAGQTDYAYYWSSTTHANWTNQPGRAAAYVSFGRGLGYMNGSWRDVHGAGSQRSDPKSGDPDDYPTGNGPQGDAIRIYNYVRLVRDIDAEETSNLTNRVFLPAISSGVAAITEAAGTVVADSEEPIGSNTTNYTRDTTNSLSATSKIGQQGPGGQAPDLAAAAAQLGVAEDVLQATLGDPTQGPPDPATAAQALGVTEAELIDALGLPQGGPQSGGTEDPLAVPTGSPATLEPTVVQPDSINEAPDPPAQPAPQSGAAAGKRAPGGQAPDLVTAAVQLGVTVEALQAALGEPGQGPPDFAGAAATLGVTEEALMETLSHTADLPPMGGPGTDQQTGPIGGQPDLSAAADELGVTEDALQAALGEPGQGPPDFAAAAATLGVTEEALMEALGISTGTMPMDGPANGQRPSGGQPPMGRP